MSSDGSVDPTLMPDQIGDTLAADSRDATEPALQARAHRAALGGYEVGPKIGEGGMGEVVLARDPRIGREVAIKRMRAAAPTPDSVDRFLREAKIQARLDHPAIVPVFDLGHDGDGRPYFTMKRLAGTTLADELARPDTALQRNLRAFAEVCLAIELAHTKGVVHRDLKPSNIMLGDYGEVYVLDWGVARVIGERTGGAGESGDITTLEGHTQVGAILGTPGYMAPEQVRGEAELGPAADVYALGSILFELLAGQALHPRGNAAIAGTLSSPQQSPARRCPDRAIAPELDAACTSALAEDPAARPSARELGERVQRYLDGDRDVEARRKLAAEQLALAKQAYADPARRAEAVRLAGHALVLDPGSKDAAAQVMTILVEPPAELPAELEAQLAEYDREIASRAARTAAFSLSAYAMFTPVVLWAGVIDWTLFALTYGVIAFMVGFAVYLTRARRPNALVPLVANFVLMLLFSRIMGPWVFVPGVIGTFTASLVAQPELIDRAWLVIGMGVASLVVPLALEWSGVFGETWRVVDGAVIMKSTALHIGGAATVVFLLLGNIALIFINGLFGRTLARTRRDAQRQLEIQAWHLRQLLPTAPPRPLPAAPSC